MTLVQNTRAKSTLKKISAYSVRKILHPCVSSVRLAHRSQQHCRVVWDYDQMGMIRHQTPSYHLDTKAVQFIRHEIEVGLSITISLEDGNGSYATLSDVMRIPGRHNSGNTRHT
jgi:hypothetical protein